MVGFQERSSSQGRRCKSQAHCGHSQPVAGHVLLASRYERLPAGCEKRQILLGHPARSVPALHSSMLAVAARWPRHLKNALCPKPRDEAHACSTASMLLGRSHLPRGCQQTWLGHPAGAVLALHSSMLTVAARWPGHSKNALCLKPETGHMLQVPGALRQRSARCAAGRTFQEAVSKFSLSILPGLASPAQWQADSGCCMHGAQRECADSNRGKAHTLRSRRTAATASTLLGRHYLPAVRWLARRMCKGGYVC